MDAWYQEREAMSQRQRGLRATLAELGRLLRLHFEDLRPDPMTQQPPLLIEARGEDELHVRSVTNREVTFSVNAEVGAIQVSSPFNTSQNRSINEIHSIRHFPGQAGVHVVVMPPPGDNTVSINEIYYGLVQWLLRA